MQSANIRVIRVRSFCDRKTMKRNLENLANQEFDVLIIGGGIYGATAAWDAALRGLKVALIEKGDFVSGTSFNSLKTIHGGLRYLQHADFVRMRESINERRILLHIAPHLVRPLPCVMPTYGHFIKGPEVMRIALLINDLVGFDRNRGLPEEQRLPAGRIISKKELLEIMPFVAQENLNGGAVWYDAQMHSSERLAMAFLHSAAEKGAELANYVAAERLLSKENRVTGARAKDMLSGESFDIHAKITVNNAGPWINSILNSLNGRYQRANFSFSTALNLMVNRRLCPGYAWGVPSKKVFKDKDAVISKGSRLYFVAPWRNVTLIGTEHRPCTGNNDEYRATEQEIESFLAEINSAMPGANIRRNEVLFSYGGLLPMAGVNPQTGDVQLVKHFQLIDHEAQDRLAGLITVLSVKYTTARGVAKSTVDLVCRKLGKRQKSLTARTKVWGGEIDNFDSFLAEAISLKKDRFSADSIRHLILNYGSGYEQVLSLAAQNSDLAEPLVSSSPISRAECLHAVRHEMALKLSDVVLRRTELGTFGHPGQESLQNCANIMAQELGWSDQRIRMEISQVESIYKGNDT